ncbi:hypothetical protein C0Q70_10112 [Pomacea canaliculata]|uniref:Uncharacterized protein n=1 Tax=Pomacea canaliculata TaxID=400727 RepID=A0A2T7PBP2_POMCA|nr:hypothetical protein C0Q70_10112 [Pomacea canaliculata]
MNEAPSIKLRRRVLRDKVRTTNTAITTTNTVPTTTTISATATNPTIVCEGLNLVLLQNSLTT